MPSLHKLSMLNHLFVNNNSLGTRGPDDLNFLCSLTNATDLQSLRIGSNDLEGSLPECTGNLSSQLLEFQLDHNHIFSDIPAGIANLLNLMYFYADNNNISRAIPESLGDLSNLRELSMSHNNLQGDIPPSLGNCKILQLLNLVGNNLLGNIPPSLGNCKTLQLLDLSVNNLSGSLPHK